MCKLATASRLPANRHGLVKNTALPLLFKAGDRMSQSKLTPFEQAVCAWLLQLPGRWTDLRWGALSSTFEKAFVRLVKGGFIEGSSPGSRSR